MADIALDKIMGVSPLIAKHSIDFFRCIFVYGQLGSMPVCFQPVFSGRAPFGRQPVHKDRWVNVATFPKVQQFFKVFRLVNFIGQSMHGALRVLTKKLQCNVNTTLDVITGLPTNADEQRGNR